MPSPASNGAALLGWVVLGTLLAAIAVVDLRTQRIPNALNAALLAGGLVVAGVIGTPDLVSAVAGVALGFLFLLAVAMAYRRARGIDGLGLGDVKFLAAAGAWVGWQGIGPTVFVAAATALVLLAARRLTGATLHRHQPIAFGPHLCLALLAVRAVQQMA